MFFVRRTRDLALTVLLPVLAVLLLFTFGLSPAASRAPAITTNPKLSPGYLQFAQAGQTITFMHSLTNTASASDTFLLEASAPVTWPLELRSSLVVSAAQMLSLTLGAGETVTVDLRFSVPSAGAIISGTEIPIVLTATSQISSELFAVVTDTVVVQLESPMTYTLYLPAIARDSGLHVAEFGADFGPSVLMSDTSWLTDVGSARELGTTWTRAWLPWAQIETAPGQYDWSWMDMQFNQFAQAGYQIDAVIYFPPPWAAEAECGPISNTLVLTQFLTAAITRYGHQVDAWEFINEPDGLVGYPSYGAAVGCWALQPQTYVAQLALFHDQVKALDPTALVVLGGLAYDNWVVFDRDFLTHTLASGAGAYFDAVSLHYYPINFQDFPTLASKINEIRAIMERHGVYDKPIWITETSMWTNPPYGLAAQQDYIVKEQTRGFCAGADKLFWFAIREDIQPPPAPAMMPLMRWLINKDHQFDQGAATYQHFTQQLAGAFCRGSYMPVPANVEAYEFGMPGGELYILWTAAGSADIVVPAGSAAVLIDRDGLTSLPLTAVNGSVPFTVDTQPVFVVVSH